MCNFHGSLKSVHFKERTLSNYDEIPLITINYILIQKHLKKLGDNIKNSLID